MMPSNSEMRKIHPVPNADRPETTLIPGNENPIASLTGEAIGMKHFMHYKAIAFDFDYTLADSSKGIIECVNFALKALDLSPASNENIRKTIGLPLSQTFIQLAGPENKIKCKEFSALFKSRADEVMTDLTYVYPATADIIPALKSYGLEIAIISTKFRYRVIEFLTRENLLGYFDQVIGGEDVQNHKPHPEALFLALRKLNLAPSEILYVGDSLPDAMATREANIPFLAVLTGVTGQRDFAQYPSVGIIRNLYGVTDYLFQDEVTMSRNQGVGPRRTIAPKDK